VPTEFHTRAGLDPERLPRMLTHSAEWVAQQGYDGLMAGKRIVVPGWGNKLMRLALGATPKWFMLSAADKSMQRRVLQPRWPKPPSGGKS
jgi:short-subunit dehydrogenase